MGAIMQPRERVEVFSGSFEHYRAGDDYGLPKWAFHWARQPEGYDGTTITLVDVLNKEASWASLLCPYGKPPTHAFDAEPDHALISVVLRLAERALGLEGVAA